MGKEEYSFRGISANRERGCLHFENRNHTSFKRQCTLRIRGGEGEKKTHPRGEVELGSFTPTEESSSKGITKGGKNGHLRQDRAEGSQKKIAQSHQVRVGGENARSVR